MSATETPGTEFSSYAEAAPEEHAPPGIGPYALAWRRLRRNKTALAFGGLFILRVKKQDVVSVAGIPIGPTWHGRFFLGADPNGRDVAVRLLYGGRNSIEIGFIATLITMILSTLIGVSAGYFRGWVDGILSRVLDVLWSYPVYILGVALGTALAVGGLNLGLFQLKGNSLGVPAVIIGVIYVPYVAKPIRGQVLSLREREFVDAARALGLGNWRIMASEIAPNVISTLVVFVPLIVANAILTEAGLSYLGAGVQSPNPSWGTMISDGIRLIPSAIHLTIVPGLMLVACVLGINVFGDGVRDALDPRAKVRIEH
jgi:peptide/nickel transport system permease protein